MEPTKKYNAIVIGATGAVGRELVTHLLNSNEYSKITVFVRRTIDRWSLLSEEHKKILNIIKVDNLDFLSGTKEDLEKKLNDSIQYDVLFNVLGSRVNKGEEEFKKVDYTYVIQSCEMCEKLNIKHFSHCSSMGTNKDSWFLYLRVKGQAEEEELKKNVDYITIFKPGMLLNRDNDMRIGEKFASWIPFAPKIDVKVLARAMYLNDIQYQKMEVKEKKKVIFENNDILKIAEDEIKDM